ncbi:DUF4426 domain-containing protein [Parashewanella tropica]|uniref:DUF4426 domain-containing protein n=1 Tax=Parashewanella tropica TaxID=2547970 RepID=UPI00105A61D8|nr:DUF4426 domain-containing protein [Parashewanella tropica]
MLRKLCAVLLFAVSFVGVAHAEQKTRVGNFDIHYIAFGSTFLTPSIAKSYGLKRSNYNGIVNISVLDTRKAGNPAVAVKISGIASNLMSSQVNLDFKEIKDGKAIYYIAEVPYQDDGTINFDIDISKGKELNTSLKFSQKFYVK